jgi:hypothetical protein
VLVKEAGGDLLRLQIVLQAVEETLAEGEEAASPADRVETLRQLRDNLLDELHALEPC